MAPGHAAGSGEKSVYTNLNKIMEEIFFIFTFAFFFVERIVAKYSQA